MRKFIMSGYHILLDWLDRYFPQRFEFEYDEKTKRLITVPLR